MTTIKRALISVSDKTGVIEFAQNLQSMGIEIISTGGTATALKEAQVPVVDISEFTGFPEIMDGRVKTLHPMVHAGILCRRDMPEHMKVLNELDMRLIDMIVVNLYPFQEVTSDPNVDLETAIENIDIGGPTMIRAAAKNHSHVTVVTDPGDYTMIWEQIRETTKVDDKTRAWLAIKVYRHTSEYDAAVESFLSNRILEERRLHITFGQGKDLRYGENSHQKAAVFIDETSDEESIVKGEILNGKEMSYNNYMDANAALEPVKEMAEDVPAVSVIKHMNPCGFATGGTVAEALEKAWEGDPISAFGGVLATNQVVDLAFAEFLKGDSVKHTAYMVQDGKYIPQEVPQGKFVELIAAPDFTDEALEFLKKKSKPLRLIKTKKTNFKEFTTLKSITGGLLIQERDRDLMEKFDVVTEKPFPESYNGLAEFGWVACKYTKSNAIVLVREYGEGKFQVMGMGAGQPNRVDSMRKLALPKAMENLEREYEKLNISQDFDSWSKEELGKMVLVSDAFFPFDDTVREAASLGIRYIVQPGGSMRDDDSIKACNELGVAMALTGLRHFNH